MAQVVHNHDTHTADSGSGMGFMLGIIALIVFMYLLFAYGLPALRGGGGGGSTTNTSEINVPEQVDVNVNPGTEGGQ